MVWSDTPAGLHFLNFANIAIVEQVRDGSTVRVRLLMPDGEHQLANIALAGVYCPRVASKPGETSEPFGEEVCALVYDRGLATYRRPPFRQNSSLKFAYYNELFGSASYRFLHPPQHHSSKAQVAMRLLPRQAYLLGLVIPHFSLRSRRINLFLSTSSGR